MRTNLVLTERIEQQHPHIIRCVIQRYIIGIRLFLLEDYGSALKTVRQLWHAQSDRIRQGFVSLRMIIPVQLGGGFLRILCPIRKVFTAKPECDRLWFGSSLEFCPFGWEFVA